jgi:hypothetical protein
MQCPFILLKFSLGNYIAKMSLKRITLIARHWTGDNSYLNLFKLVSFKSRKYLLLEVK